jgi:uncharacterized membrane protein
MKTLKTFLLAAAISVASGLTAQPAQAFCCGFFGFGGGFHVGSGWGWGSPWGYYPGWGGWGDPYYAGYWGGPYAFPYYGYPLAGYPVYTLPPLVVTTPELLAKK